MGFILFLNSVQLGKVEKILFPLADQYFHGYILSQAGNSEEYGYLSLFSMLSKSNKKRSIISQHSTDFDSPNYQFHFKNF